MPVQAYLNFKGNCREAIHFYAKVFGSPPPQIMAYGDMPPQPGFTPDPATKNLIMHAELKLADGSLLFSDAPPGVPLTIGDNISLIVQSADEAAIRKWFAGLSEGGTLRMPLEKTFWTPLYGYVTDRFGVGWQFNLLV